MKMEAQKQSRQVYLPAREYTKIRLKQLGALSCECICKVEFITPNMDELKNLNPVGYNFIKSLENHENNLVDYINNQECLLNEKKNNYNYNRSCYTCRFYYKLYAKSQDTEYI